jgi:hypothetical protein
MVFFHTRVHGREHMKTVVEDSSVVRGIMRQNDALMAAKMDLATLNQSYIVRPW